MRPSRILIVLILGAGIGFSVFGFLAWRAVEVEKLTHADATQRIVAARAAFGAERPRFVIDANGQLVSLEAPTAEPVEAPADLHVLAFREGLLVKAEVPFWFLKLKEPVAQLALRGTGFDPVEMGWTAEELARGGPGLLLDQRGEHAERLLVWAE